MMTNKIASLIPFTILAFLLAGSFLTLPAQAEADLKNGERVALRCKACHNFTQSDRARLGPNLNGVFGRPAGKLAGYNYSAAMAEVDFIWDAAKLNEWLTGPRAFVPGNKMPFAGVKDPQDREDLIAYLKQATAE